MEVKLSTEVKQISKEIAMELYKILKQERIFVKKTSTIYQKTERLLNNLAMIKVSIDNKKLMLENVKRLVEEQVEVRRKEGLYPYTGIEYDIKREEQNKIEQDIHNLEAIVRITENGLESISNHKYFKIIDMKYNRNKTIETIAEELHISVATVKRSRKEMIKQLGVIIFSDEIIKEILN